MKLSIVSWLAVTLPGLNLAPLGCKAYCSITKWQSFSLYSAIEKWICDLMPMGNLMCCWERERESCPGNLCPILTALFLPLPYYFQHPLPWRPTRSRRPDPRRLLLSLDSCQMSLTASREYCWLYRFSQQGGKDQKEKEKEDSFQWTPSK